MELLGRPKCGFGLLIYREKGTVPQILDMRFQIALTPEHVADLLEFRSASLEIRRRKKEKKKESVVKYKSADMYVWRPNNSNKSAQSNLGKGPRRGTVAHVRRKVPIGYHGAPEICPKSTPSRGPIPKLLIRSAVIPQCTGQTDRRTDRPTHRPTDRPRESLIAIGGCATRATPPNYSKFDVVSLQVEPKLPHRSHLVIVVTRINRCPVHTMTPAIKAIYDSGR